MYLVTGRSSPPLSLSYKEHTMNDSKPPLRYPGTGIPEDECPPASGIDIEGFAQRIREQELPSILSLMSLVGPDNGANNYDEHITPLSLKQRLSDNKIDWVQWNVRKTENGLYLGRDCNDHPAVRGTDYMEIHNLLGTSGCSPQEPYWDWSVMGVIQTTHGKQVVVPGDWIGTLIDGVYVVVSNAEYRMCEQHDPS